MTHGAAPHELARNERRPRLEQSIDASGSRMKVETSTAVDEPPALDPPGNKRIVILVSHEDPSGAPMAALRLANGLHARGNDVTVRFLYSLKRMDSPYHPYEVVSATSRPSPLDYARILIKVIRYLRAEKPDAVVTFMPLAHAVGQFGAVLAGVKRRVVSHRSPIDTYSRLMRGIDAAMVYSGFYSDLVLVSNAVRVSCHYYPRRVLDRSRVVHNALLNWKPSQLSKEEARAALDLPMSEFVLASVGRIDPQKNYAFLVPIMAQLRGVTLVIAGAGSLQGELEQRVAEHRIGDKVRLLGAVPRSRVPDILQAADMFVQPSLFEGQSNALLEALHAGLPVLSSDVPEQIEALTDTEGGIAGAVLPLSDPDAWVTSITHFRDNPDALDRARSLARARARAFSFDRMISGFEQAVLGAGEGATVSAARSVS
jgi:glycosyltransferase involved in cell wall biosynthesis